MGECGCYLIEYKRKIIDEDGNAWLFGIYPSCDCCDSPVCVNFIKVKRKDWQLYNIENIPPIDTYGDEQFFVVVDQQKVRLAMEKAIIGYRPHNGIVDQIDAEALSKEAFSDLRNVVFESQE